RFVLPWVLLFTALTFIHAQNPDAPTTDPGSFPNVFYGEIPPEGDHAPVLVFIHGLRGTASDWWVDNEMYALAYREGYRTAFVSMSPDNSRNDAPIQDNAEVLKTVLPTIAERFGVSKVYFICHSKGGLDLQAAMIDPVIAGMAQAVFHISTPNQGSELADWAFGPGRDVAERLGLLTPGVEALQTSRVQQLRAQVDPILKELNIPFYTTYGRTFRGHPVTLVTGAILLQLAPGTKNDGFVTSESSLLPVDFGINIGEVHGHHFEVDTGAVSFAKINAHITGLELTRKEFTRIAGNGFGDRFNTWMWSMQWFKGRLYVGTGRAVQCATFATAAAQSGIPALYPPIVGDCTDEPEDLPLAAEIWRYTPETKTWDMVYKAPETIPIAWDENGQPTKFTARDTGYRGMAVHRESNGQEALYVAATTSSSIFDNLPQYQGQGFPPPRILRSVDGENFAPIPQEPGTYLGDIVQLSSQENKVRGFRSLASYKGKLFATASDFRGLGIIIASSHPELGNDAWEQVSPPVQEFPVWTLKVFNGYLYCTTGDRVNPVGYGVYKTDAEGAAPYTFQPIVTQGAYQNEDVLRSPDALSMEEFQGKLYVGSDRPTEMIRINTDDTWELVVGNPRDTLDGPRAPITGIGQFFGNYFSGHFWRMKSYDDHLYMGTWDWSQSLRAILVLDSLFRPQYGTDVFKTRDGKYWDFVTRSGFGNPFNYGTRSFEVSPWGLFLGTAKPEGGGEIHLNQSHLDFDGDEDIDQDDVNLLMARVGEAANGPNDPMDIDRDGQITVFDASKLSLACTKPSCEVITPEPRPPAPQRLEAASFFAVGNHVDLTWDPVPGAVKYRVYRSEVRPLLELLPPNLKITIPDLDLTIEIPDDFVSGRFDPFCAIPENESNLLCVLNTLFQTVDLTSGFLGLPLRFYPVATTTETAYSEPAPTELQSLYYVVAIDSDSKFSLPSNLVAGPSWAAPETFDANLARLTALQNQSANPSLIAALIDAVKTARRSFRNGNYRSAQTILKNAIDSLPVEGDDTQKEAADLLKGLSRSIRLVQAGVYHRSVPDWSPSELASRITN
ncbi:MAG TPA: hypothetical protein VKZ59_08130, partial [Acidobacteriota bacterium]|nr:hypothetical protein [Acidobacteriota bacterium]